MISVMWDLSACKRIFSLEFYFLLPVGFSISIDSVA